MARKITAVDKKPELINVHILFNKDQNYFLINIDREFMTQGETMRAVINILAEALQVAKNDYQNYITKHSN